MTTVFCYGTLRHGFGNHTLLRNSEFRGFARTNPLYTMLNMGSFPGVIRKGTTPIFGELYEVDDDTLTMLDRLEGHPDFYFRDEIIVSDHDNQMKKASIYLLPLDWMSAETRVVYSGEWSKA